jgi:hypothetical protein
MSLANPIRHHVDRRAHSILAEIPDAGAAGHDELLSTKHVADWLGISTVFLEIGRSKGYGPAFVRVAPRCVRYKKSDVIGWLNARVHRSTAEYQRGSKEEAA